MRCFRTNVPDNSVAAETGDRSGVVLRAQEARGGVHHTGAALAAAELFARVP